MKHPVPTLQQARLFQGIKILLVLLVIVFYGSFLFSKINLPGALDLPRQIQNGKDVLAGNFDVLTKNVYSYVEPGHAFANHHWFFGVVSYALYYSIGWVGIDIVRISIILLTFLLLFWLALKHSDAWVVAAWSVPTIFILMSRVAFRPELFSYLFVAIFLLLLFDLKKYPHHNKIFWLIPVMVIWVNTHLFFPIGILLVSGMLVQEVVVHRKDWKRHLVLKKLGIVLGALMVTLFLNPYGLGGVIYSLTVNTASEFPIHSMEVTTVARALHADPSWANVSLYLYVWLVALLCIFFAITVIYRIKNKISLYEGNSIFLFLASVGSAGLSYFIFRALPLFGAIFLITITYLSHPFYTRARQWVQKQDAALAAVIRWTAIVVLFAITIISILIGQRKIMQYRERGIGLADNALSSVEFFKRQHLKGPILNDTDSGSYLIGQLYPQEKVFADNRFGDAYSEHFFSDIYLPMLQNETVWHDMLEQYQFNVIFMYHYDLGEGTRDFIFRRINDPEWVWVYVDRFNVILVRNTIENKAIIDSYRVTYDSAPEELRYLIESDKPKDKLNAADILNLIGRTDVSIPLYLQYLSLRPEDGEIWYVLGKTELRKGDQSMSNPSLAMIYLEQAIKNGWKTWESYSYLALAYYRTGQFERVKEAVRKELKINPDGEDAKRWVKIINDEELKIKSGN